MAIGWMTSGLAVGWVIVHPSGRVELDYFFFDKFMIDTKEVTRATWRKHFRPDCRMVRGTLIPWDMIAPHEGPAPEAPR